MLRARRVREVARSGDRSRPRARRAREVFATRRLRTRRRSGAAVADFVIASRSATGMGGSELTSSRRSRLLFLDSIPDEAAVDRGTRRQCSSTTGELAAHVERLLTLPRVRAHLTDVVMQWLELHRIETAYKDPLYQLSAELKATACSSRRGCSSTTRDVGVAAPLSRADGRRRIVRRCATRGVVPNVAPASWECARGRFTAKSAQHPHAPRRADDARTSRPSRSSFAASTCTQVPLHRGAGTPAIRRDRRDNCDHEALHETQNAHFRAQHVYCSTCHKTIDPPGFALHAYDVAGRWRARSKTIQVIANDVLLRSTAPSYRCVAAPSSDACSPRRTGRQMRRRSARASRARPCRARSRDARVSGARVRAQATAASSKCSARSRPRRCSHAETR